ncbi:hypothetical protein BSAF29S_06291 [Bacillus safensis subsp. safensis]
MKTNRSDWSEERIKVLLSQLPKVEDNRSSKQIYQQVLMASGKKKKVSNGSVQRWQPLWFYLWRF